MLRAASEPSSPSEIEISCAAAGSLAQPRISAQSRIQAGRGDATWSEPVGQVGDFGQPNRQPAGVVEAVGPEASRFQIGDRVWGTNQGLMGRQGTFAEFCAVDECWLYPTPDGVSDETAAACSLVGVTAHLGLFRAARLSAGEALPPEFARPEVAKILMGYYQSLPQE